MKRKTSKILSVLLALVMMFSLVPAASAAGTTVPVEKISIKEKEIKIQVDEELALHPTVEPDNATNKEISWSSDRTNIATVDRDGLVTGKSVGTAIITAKAGTKEDKCLVEVTPANRPAKTISLDKTSEIVRENETITLTATVDPENTTDTIKWESKDTSIATVSSTVNGKGVVTGKKAGTVGITVTAGKLTPVECSVRVVKNEVQPTVTLDPSTSTTMYTNKTFTLKATLSPDTLTADWDCSVSDTTIIKATPNTTAGTWTIESNTKTGESTITITDKNTGVKNTCKVTVKSNTIGNNYLSFNGSSVTVDPGYSKLVTVSSTSYRNGETVEWSVPSNSYVYLSTSSSGASSSRKTTVTTTFDYYNYNTTSVYVYGHTTGGPITLTATLLDKYRNPISTPIQIPVYVGTTNRTGYYLSPNPSNGSAVSLYYDNYYRDDYWWDSSYRYYRDFTVTPMKNTINLLDDPSRYSISYAWTLNGRTQADYSSANSARTYRLYANNSALYSSSRNNVLTCTARITDKDTSTIYYETVSVDWTVYTDYYYDYDFTVSATVYDTTNKYNLNDKDDKNGSSIISQISNKLNSGDYISYVRFSNVTSSYGSLDASTSRDYYYDSYRTSSYDLRDVTFAPSKTGTASFDCTVYTTRGYNYKCTINIKVEAGTTDKTASTINYSTKGTKSVTLSASDFTSRYKDVVGSSPSTLTIKFRNVPSNGTLKYNSTTLTSSNIGNYEFSSSSSGSYRISDLTYTPKNNSNTTDTIDYYCYSGSTRRFSGSVKFTNTAEADTVPSGVTVSYSTTGASVTFSAPDFYNRHSAMLSASYIIFGSPTSGTLSSGGSAVASGTKFGYTVDTSKGYKNLASVSYKPASGYNGTATIPFTAYNSDGTTAATGSVSILVSQTTTTTPTTPTNTAKTFKDVASTAWYANDVAALSAAGIVSGDNNGNFRPQDAVTYGEALKMVLIASGYPKQTELTGANWAQNYLTQAISNSILSGSASDYTLSKSINRTAMATVAAKALKLTPVTNSASSPYKDTTDSYVLALTNAGIVQGDASSGETKWRGGDTLTRAEMSRIVYNIYKYRNVAPGGTSTSTDTSSKPDWLK